MNNNSDRIERDLRILGTLLAELPEDRPPRELMTGVMSRITPKQPSLKRRIMRRLTTPINVAVTPLRLAPVCAAAAALLLAFTFMSAGPDTPTMPTIATAPSGQAAGHVPVTFTLQKPDASSVAVIGNFNQWTPTGYTMQYDNDKDLWRITVSLPQGRHIYGFLVDGNQVMPDPQALMKQDDGFGNQNSILIIDEGGNGHETAL